MRGHRRGARHTTGRFGGDTRPAGRVAILLGLLLVATVSLRGRVPEVRPGADEPAADSPASLAGVIALLASSVLIMGIALVASFRKRAPDLPAGHWEPPRGAVGPRARLHRRLLLVAAFLAVAWLTALMLGNLLRDVPIDVAQQPPPVPSASPGQPVAPSPPPAGSRAAQPDGRVLQYLQVTTVVLVAMTLAGTVVTAVRRRRRRVAEDRDLGAAAEPLVEAPPVEASADEPLAVAAERGLAEVADLSRGPREAIIACYAAMERALADSPGVAPKESDTPSEVLARAVGSGALRVGSATRLVELFAEARFSRHVMTEEHRDVAERALRAVLDELRQPAG